MEDQSRTDNYQFASKPTLQEIDDLAHELCNEYSNHGFYRWYCKVINVLGIERVKIIKAMYSDTKQAKHLFSRRASEEMVLKQAQQRMLDIRRKNAEKD